MSQNSLKLNIKHTTHQTEF